MSPPNRLRNLCSVDVVAARDTPAHSPCPSFWLDGSSAAITKLRGQIRRVAPYFRTALLVGEPGCGQEAAAQYLHQLSALSRRPFVDLALTDTVALFRDSHADHVLASIGTFYISRPEQLSRSIQDALLGLLRRHGSQAPRLVAFTERSLRPLISTSGFSAELADALGALRIVIPPLRDRSEDIPQILTLMLQGISRQSGARLPELALDLLDAARLLPWRGNLTQLAAVAEGLIERANRLTLHALDLDVVLGAISPPNSHPAKIRMLRLDYVVQEHIRAVLFACNGNKVHTAEILGISRSTLYRMLDFPSQPNSNTHESSTLQTPA